MKLMFITIVDQTCLFLTQINSQSLEDTQVEYILQKYTSDKYTFGKYTFEKYTLRFTLNSVWGPVEWVGDQFTGWGWSFQKQYSKINGLCFFYLFFI